MRINKILGILILVGSRLAGTSPAGTECLRLPSFTSEAEILMQASKLQKPVEGMAVIELLEETQIVLAPDGSRETRYRYIFRVDHESGVEGWRTISATWKPWNQVRPGLKARVITPDGLEHHLDPATIGESPIHDDARVFDDRRRLTAPLPKLCVGAVAEVEVVSRETAPAFPGGSLITVVLRQPVPVLQTRVTIEAPEAMPLKWKVRGLAGTTPVRTADKGRSRLCLEVGRMDPPEGLESHEPADAHPVPALLVSTVPTWATVAKAYSDIVDRQLAGSNLGDRAVADPADGNDLRKRVNRILARLHRDIRYTGLEFGAASVIPRSPTEVSARGYGDCKDKATLLVGTLRAAGIDAHVALLNTGPGEDVEEALPGLNHFDHAIVFVPGPDPLWIDATADHYRAGELPFPDQGRKALVASLGTTSLTLIPSSKSSDYLVQEVREIHLADVGPARVIEISSPTGLGECHLRSELSNTEPKRLRENLKKYVQGAYEAKELVSYDMPDPDDLSKPFTLRLEAADSKLGNTFDFEALVTINLWNMTEKLRRYVPVPPDKEPATPLPLRKHDLLFQDPHSVAWEYRIYPPAGFSARALPPADLLSFGPATLSRAFSLREDGTVVGTFRFDSGKARWTASEYEAARQAIGAFGRSAPTSIGFDLTAEAHLSAGRIRESIQAYRTYVASRPGKAAPLSKLAMALLKGGMGELAREEAGKACALEPGSMYAQRTLGYILLHDLVGRQFRKGWDRPGAIKAMREAKRLDPTDKLARRNLAILLEYNEAGERYGAGSQLDLAIEEYQNLRKDLKADDVDVSLLLDLSKMARFKDLEEFARSLPPSSTRSAWMIVSAALNRGVDAALAEASSIVPDANQRRSALLTAGDILVPLRRYQEAAGVLSAGAVGSNDASAIRSRAAIMGKARRIDDSAFDPKLPSTVAWNLMKALLVDGKEGRQLSGYFSPAAWAVIATDPETTSVQRSLKGSLSGLTRLGLTPQVGLDLAVALCQVTVEGDDQRGHKVRFQMPGGNDLTFYVIQLQGKYLISVMDDQYALFGVEAARRLDGGDLDGARTWLDWARGLAWAGNSEDPLSGAILCRFWTKGQPASLAELRLAAVSMQVGEKACSKVPAQLLEARKGTSTTVRQQDLELALCSAYWASNDGERMEPLARQLYTSHPTSKVAARYLTRALSLQKKWEALVGFCDEVLRLRPDDLAILGHKAHALSALDRPEEKARLLKGLVDRGLATDSEFNNLAWGNLMAGKSDDETLEFARRSLLLKSSGNAGSMHTLASVLAERGEVTEALELMSKMLQEADRDEPRGEDWYVFARIAEQFGERKLALSRYKKVTPPGPLELEADSCHLLAARRIQQLSK